MSEVAALERNLSDAKELVRKREVAKKLYNNPEFKELIIDEFCVKECARFVHSSADPNLDADQRADALAMAQAAGHLRRFLSTIILMGNTAEGNIEDIEAELVEARQEEDNA